MQPRQGLAVVAFLLALLGLLGVSSYPLVGIAVCLLAVAVLL